MIKIEDKKEYMSGLTMSERARAILKAVYDIRVSVDDAVRDCLKGYWLTMSERARAILKAVHDIRVSVDDYDRD